MDGKREHLPNITNIYCSLAYHVTMEMLVRAIDLPFVAARLSQRETKEPESDHISTMYKLQLLIEWFQNVEKVYRILIRKVPPFFTLYLR